MGVSVKFVDRCPLLDVKKPKLEFFV
jgi:hypothetical protein